MFNRMLYLKEPEITPALIESVAVVHFARYAQQMIPHTKPNEVAFYWKNKKETDIVLRTKEDLFAVEVKYQNKISKEDFGSLHHFKEGIIATKTTLKIGSKYSVVPMHILLALI